MYRPQITFVGLTVIAFVFAAAAISLAGLGPASKADAESFAKDKLAVEKPHVTSKKNVDSIKGLAQVELGNSG